MDTLSLPGFYDNFDVEQDRLISDELNTQLIVAVNSMVETPAMRQVV